MLSVPRKKVLAISGSTRSQSANLHLINAIAALAANRWNVEIFQGLAALPHFNPDLDTEAPPESVTHFRDLLKKADGVLICTPEYVFSLPGSLKNAIEWTVSTTLFSQKPVALVTAATLGQKAHEALQLIMKTVEAKTDAQSQLLISSVNSKLSADGRLIDATTLNAVQALVTSFTEAMHSCKAL